MSFSVEGKTAIVTGSGTGVGLAIARHLIDRGANVMCADEDDGALADAFGEQARYEGRVRTFACRMSERLGSANLMSATLDAFDRIDVLVNAHRLILPSDPLGIEPDAMEETLSNNLMGALRLSQAVARRMIAQNQAVRDQAGEAVAEVGSGAIINISSIAAQRVRADNLAYSVSCAAVEQMTRALAVALAPRRIRVNALAVGSITHADPKTGQHGQAGRRQDILRLTPLGRIAGAAELAEAVQFLASDAAGFITGQILTVDGGRGLVDPVGLLAH
jgi:7-alpha-hydroxysteroid dehydrogenase